MQALSSTPFADIIASLAVLHREQQQALLELRSDQERCFQAILQTQQEGREAFRSWIDWEVPREPTEQPASPPASLLSPRQPFSPLSATGAAGRSGPACWRCGDPDHFVDKCPVMEVGTMIRVPDDPQAAPGQAGGYQIPTDASDRGLGAVLSQEIEGEERPVLYISRKLSKREAKYSTVEKECLAIRWAVLTLRYYLLGREFTLCSDHAPLQWLHRMKDTNARITRWYLALQPFKFKVVHRSGVRMAVADFLSRNGGGGGGLQAGQLPSLSRAVGSYPAVIQWDQSLCVIYQGETPHDAQKEFDS
ncbi:uncharacterized protein LOC125251877 [Megalobrama amblycephala]|uniref:uncharacterized protein LOC125251877 n=1 Tax=Megalobrama amblycephala TaxID=75352 RepID=UPI002014592A|nr:uncharacterized protein LOC125251877 [Megalobrama amblycephala]